MHEKSLNCHVRVFLLLNFSVSSRFFHNWGGHMKPYNKTVRYDLMCEYLYHFSHFTQKITRSTTFPKVVDKIKKVFFYLWKDQNLDDV